MRGEYKAGPAVQFGKDEEGKDIADWSKNIATIAYNNFPTINYGGGIIIPDGLTYTFTYPGALSAPEAGATDLVLSATPSSIAYSFTPAETAQTYLVVYTEGDAEPNAPVDGTYYKPGESIGNGVVAYFGKALEEGDKEYIRNANPKSTYNVYVYANNSYGPNGPLYYPTPLVGTINTTPYAPASVEATSSTLNSVSGVCEANEDGDNVLVV